MEELIKLYNDDCLKVLPTLEQESIDCVVTDCPYKIVSGGCTTETYMSATGNKAPSGISNKRKENLDLSQQEDVKKGKMFANNMIEFREWLPPLYRVLKNGAHCYIMINARNLKTLQSWAERVGFKYQNLLIWDKGTATPNRYYLNAFECILMLRKGVAKNINNLGTKSILRIKAKVGGRLHPTEKPVELMKILIENSTKEGESVIDPFMGAGSTGLACRELGRKFIGIELDKKYYQIAKERIENEELK